ncbi:MAG: insulinase family protein [Acidobacteria bacterium]|nr:insulinase family protein [Acidobacteriota bacterium]
MHAQSRQWPIENPPGPLAAREIKFPPYEIQTLPNGLQVIAILHHEQPAVTMRLLVRAGTSADPRGKLGLVHLLASLLDQGTTAKSAQEMNDAVDFIGGAMGAGAGTDLTFVNMMVMKDSFENGMRMLSEMARHPAFAQREIERQRQQTLSGLQVSAEDPEWIANSVFDRLVYGFHPYGMPDNGTPETLAGITREDLVAFHASQFAPNNAILAIVGDVTADEAFTTAKKVFGDWQKQDLAAQTFIDPPDPTRRVIVVNKPDAVQTEVRVGHLGITRTHPDYMAVNLAIRILGGEGSNRLHQVLRTERSLTYGAQANMDALKQAGDFEAETNTRSDATTEVLRLIVDQFWRLQRERVSDRELDGAKAYMTGSFPLTIETPEAIAMQVMNAVFYGLPLDQLQTFRGRVNAVTPDDVQRVARALLRPDRLSVVLVGNAAAFTSQLNGVGFGNFETVELADLDLTSANFKRARTRADAAGGARGAGRAGRAMQYAPYRSPQALQTPQTSQAPLASRASTDATPEEQAKAMALLDRAIAAKGGLDKLRTLKTIVAKQTQTSHTPNGPAETQTTNYIQYPDKFLVEAPGLTQGFDGAQAWAMDARGVRVAPDTVARDARASLRRDVLALLLDAKRGALKMRLLADAKDAAGHVSQALELSAADLDPVILYFNPDSALVEKRAFAASAPGRPIVEEQFSDYRPVDGIQMPFHATQTVGALVVERQIIEVKINPAVEPAFFKRPAS